MGAQGREGARAPETTRFVSLDEPRYLLAARHPLFSPSAAQAVHFLAHDAPAPVLALLEDMGVRRLEDHDVCELFVLPTFSSLASSKQRAVREHLLRHWHAFRQHDRLREAPFFGSSRTLAFIRVPQARLALKLCWPDSFRYATGGARTFARHSANRMPATAPIAASATAPNTCPPQRQAYARHSARHCTLLP